MARRHVSFFYHFTTIACTGVYCDTNNADQGHELYVRKHTSTIPINKSSHSPNLPFNNPDSYPITSHRILTLLPSQVNIAAHTLTEA